MLVALDAPCVTAFLTLYFETCELLKVAEMQNKKKLRRKMSFVLGGSAACFKYFRGIWVVNKTHSFVKNKILFGPVPLDLVAAPWIPLCL